MRSAADGRSAADHGSCNVQVNATALASGLERQNASILAQRIEKCVHWYDWRQRERSESNRVPRVSCARHAELREIRECQRCGAAERKEAKDTKKTTTYHNTHACDVKAALRSGAARGHTTCGRTGEPRPDRRSGRSPP